MLRYQRGFLLGSGVVLLVTGFAKLFTLTGDTTLLDLPDPVFGVRFSTLMLVVGLTELVIAGFCLFSKRNRLTVLMVAWIASGFLVYRTGIRTLDWQRPCGCLGNLTDVLSLSPQAADWISVGLLGFLLIGSYGLLFFGERTSCAQFEAEPSTLSRSNGVER